MVPLIALSVFAVLVIAYALLVKNSRFDNTAMLDGEYLLFEDNGPKIILQKNPKKGGQGSYLAFARIRITTKRIWIGQKYLFGSKIKLTALTYFNESDIPQNGGPWYKRSYAVFTTTPLGHSVRQDKEPPEVRIPVTPRFGAYYNIGEVLIRSSKRLELLSALNSIKA